MDLIIVESPTKAKTLARFLGGSFRIEATMGHIRDLPQKKFGIKTDRDFEPQYVIMPGKEAVVENIRKQAEKAKKIYLATDPDREGEAIAYHLTVICSNFKFQISNFKFSRIVFHEITKSAIEKALANPREIDRNLVNAQQARRILDRIVGYKLSPLLWFKIRKGLSAGRVQSVAVRLIVDREREIEKFVPVEYWEIFADLKKHLGGQMPTAPVFRAKLEKKNGQKIEIHRQNESEEIVLELKNAGYEIQGVEKRIADRFPSPPFTTSTLQQTAANRLGWPAKKTMSIAQRLYEQGLITYHRTDSTNIAREALFSVRNYIKKTFGEDFLPEKPRFYKTKSKTAQEAHEAVRPTDVRLQVQSSKFKVQSEDERRLYEIIWKRFVACQMAEAKIEETTVEVLAAGKTNHFLLETKGEVEKFAGWKKVYGQKEEEVIILPPLAKGDELELVGLLPEQKFTLAPPRFTEASLIKTLEEYGIGRPSTYAPIISTIQDRQYVEKSQGKFLATALGTAVNDFLVDYFPEVVNFEFTARMENDLDEIASGKKEWVPVVREFYIPFSTKLVSVSHAAERVKVETEATDENCPDCGAPLVVRIGRFGKFLSCSKFPNCRFTKPFSQKAGFNCEKCGAEMVVRRVKKGLPAGRQGRFFYGCSCWPKCDFATWKKPRSPAEGIS